MSTRRIVPRIVKFALWLIGISLVLFAIQVMILAYPQLLLSHSAQSGTVTIHYDGEMNPYTRKPEIITHERRSKLVQARRSHPDRIKPTEFYPYFFDKTAEVGYLSQQWGGIIYNFYTP